MRCVFQLLVAIGLTLSVASALALSQYPSSQQRLRNVDGRFMTLAELKGEKGTLIIFSSNHCPFVKGWIDRIVAIGNQAQSQQIGVALINSNDPRAFPEDGFSHMRALALKKKMKFPYLEDATSQMAPLFTATRTPEAFLFHPSGRLVYHGAIDDNFENAKEVQRHYLKDALEQLLAGKTVTPAKTKFIGCSIKLREKSDNKEK